MMQFCSKRGHNAECKCKPGFLQTIEGECVKTIGSDCEVLHYEIYVIIS